MSKKKKARNNPVQLYTALPHEAPLVKDMMVSLFNEIGAKEEAECIDGFMQELYNSLNRTRYNNLWIALDGYHKTHLFDIERIQDVMLGFMWQEVEQGLNKKLIGTIQQFYVKKGSKRTMVFTALINKYIYFTKQNMIELHRVEAPTYELQQMWARMGYKPVRSLMEMKGKASALLENNKVLDFIDKRTHDVEQTEVKSEKRTINATGSNK